MIRFAFSASSLILALVVALLTACQSTGPSGSATTTSGISVREVGREPVVRVRIAQQVQRATLGGAPGGGGAGGGSRINISGTAMAGPVEVQRHGGRFAVRSTSTPGPWLGFDTARLHIAPAAGGHVSFQGSEFPGQLILLARDGAGFDVINAVPIESYLPGVLERELFPKWHRQTYEAQAIAARSYAIAHLPLSRDKAFDLESTVASQAYGGAGQNTTALAAVEATRGKVLTWQGRVIPAYYSSNAGGTGQDAAPAIKGGPDIAPLRGVSHGGWAAASPRFSWGPIARDRADLTTRLAAWGRANRHPVANLRGLADVIVAHRNSAGRPTGFIVTDVSGQRFAMGPEQFRFAANFVGTGTAPLPESLTLYSSFVELRPEAGRIIITGRGHGHGVGMDQWAAQAMALRGHSHTAILAFFYPGARIDTAY